MHGSSSASQFFAQPGAEARLAAAEPADQAQQSDGKSVSQKTHALAKNRPCLVARLRALGNLPGAAQTRVWSALAVGHAGEVEELSFQGGEITAVLIAAGFAALCPAFGSFAVRVLGREQIATERNQRCAEHGADQLAILIHLQRLL